MNISRREVRRNICIAVTLELFAAMAIVVSVPLRKLKSRERLTAASGLLWIPKAIDADELVQCSAGI